MSKQKNFTDELWDFFCSLKLAIITLILLVSPAFADEEPPLNPFGTPAIVARVAVAARLRRRSNQTRP